MKKILIIGLIVLFTFSGYCAVTKIEDNSLISSENSSFSSYSEESSFSSITISNDINFSIIETSKIESDIISEETTEEELEIIEESIPISEETTEEEIEIIYVYITTKAGEKYHKASCRWIKDKDTQRITLEEATSQGYTACKTCKP